MLVSNDEILVEDFIFEKCVTEGTMDILVIAEADTTTGMQMSDEVGCPVARIRVSLCDRLQLVSTVEGTEELTVSAGGELCEDT